MTADVLLASVGGQQVKPYFDFFHEFCLHKNIGFRITSTLGGSKERCSQTFSMHFGDGFGDIPSGKADVVLALEQLEGLRYRRYVKDDGAIVLSSKRIVPTSVITRTAAYPENIFQKCLNDCFLVFGFDDDHILAALLTLRALGYAKEDLMDGVDVGLYTPDQLESAFKVKPIKA